MTLLVTDILDLQDEDGNDPDWIEIQDMTFNSPVLKPIHAIDLAKYTKMNNRGVMKIVAVWKEKE